MTETDDDRIRRLVEEFDQLVSRDKAWIRLDQYGGGPDEGRMVANQAGYFRFGIELLKAGLMPSNSAGPSQFRVAIDLKYLITDDSIIGFDEFIRDDSPPGIQQKQRWSTDFIGIVLAVGCISVVLAVVTFAVIGVIAVIGRAW